MKNKWLYKLGWILILVACLCWIALLIIPFLPLSVGMKAAGITGGLILGEVFFWGGTLFVGKEVISQYKGYLNPKQWRKKDRD